MAIIDSNKAADEFEQMLNNGVYNLDDWSRNSANNYSEEKEERDKKAVIEFVNSDAFDVIRKMG